MAVVLLLGVPASVYKNDEKLHIWNQVIVILEPIESESHNVPWNEGKSVYYLEPGTLKQPCRYNFPTTSVAADLEDLSFISNLHCTRKIVPQCSLATIFYRKFFIPINQNDSSWQNQFWKYCFKFHTLLSKFCNFSNFLNVDGGVILISFTKLLFLK